MPAAANSQELIELIKKSSIVTAAALNKVLDEVGTLPDDAIKAAGLLVRHGMLTPFQAKLLLAGRHRGFRLGPYVIREQIGQGGMGTVYQAEHETLKRKVALKVLAPGEEVNRVSVERFMREARAAAALDHPNIVRIFDVAKQGELHYLVMEFVEGQTLDKIVETAGPMACGRAVEYVMQAASGLQHAYEKGFVHRDIKPGNLILSKDGALKILDMGLARSIEKNEKLTEVFDKGAVVGTADYISPEQAMNSPDLDIRADIYSLGATFFTLVTGKPPFEGNTTQKLLQHQMKEPPLISAVDKTFPPGLAQVVKKMLQKKPEDRYQTPAEVMADLAGWAPGTAHVVAALSSTNLQRSQSMQIALSEVVANSSKRLAQLPDDDVEEEVPAKSKWMIPVIALCSAIVVLGALLGIAFATGLFSDSSTPMVQNTGTFVPSVPTTPNAVTPNNTQPTQKSTTTPATQKTSTPPAASNRGLLVYDLDLKASGNWFERGKTTLPDPSMPNKKQWIVTQKSDTGKLPNGWQNRSWNTESEVEFRISTVDGQPVLSCQTLSGPGSAMLFSPELNFPSASGGKLTIEYKTEGGDAAPNIRIRQMKPNDTPAVDVQRLAVTNNQWKTAVIDLPTLAYTQAIIEIHPGGGKSTQQKLSLRKFTIREQATTVKPLYALDLSRQQPFMQKVIKDPYPTGKDPVQVLEQTGSGERPPLWTCGIEKDAVGEIFADGTTGNMAFGIRPVSGKTGISLLSPEATTTSGKFLVRVAYSLNAGDCVLKFRPNDKKPVVEVGKLPATGGSSQLLSFPVETKDSATGVFELFNGNTGADSALRLFDFQVLDPNQIAPVPPRTSPDAKPIFTFEPTQIPEFKATVENGKQASELPRLPVGVGARNWMKGSIGEFRCTTHEGSKALGLLNLNDKMTAQYSFEFEKDMGITLTPGKTYRLVVTFATTNDAVGFADIQDYQYKTISRAVLSQGPTGWRTAEVRFLRGESQFRIVVENTTAGEGNMLFFKKIEVIPVD